MKQKSINQNIINKIIILRESIQLRETLKSSAKLGRKGHFPFSSIKNHPVKPRSWQSKGQAAVICSPRQRRCWRICSKVPWPRPSWWRTCSRARRRRGQTLPVWPWTGRRVWWRDSARENARRISDSFATDLLPAISSRITWINDPARLAGAIAWWSIAAAGISRDPVAVDPSVSGNTTGCSFFNVKRRF